MCNLEGYLHFTIIEDGIISNDNITAIDKSIVLFQNYIAWEKLYRHYL